MVKIAFYILVSILLMAPITANSATNRTIIMAADNWCPYTCSPGKSVQPGYLIDIVNAIFKPKGYNLKVQFSSWHDAIEQAKEGKIDGLIGTYRGDVPDFVFPTVTTGNSIVAFFVRKENPWRYKGAQSLENVSIGIVGGYDYGDPGLRQYIETHTNTPRVQVATGEDALRTNFTKVYYGKVGATMEDIAVATYMITKLKFTRGFKQAGILGEPNPVYIVFSPKIPQAKEYATILSEGIISLRKSGELQKILATYGLTDWEQPQQAASKSQL